MLNVDAAFQYELHRLGAGYVLRDLLSSFLATSRWSSDRVDCPKLDKAMAVWHALLFALEIRYDKAVFASIACHSSKPFVTTSN
jgi:hypothetical protein